MKSVCVVGAGPSGLVAAKTLLQAGCFNVTVYEQSDSIGGIWAFPRASKGNYYLHSRTPTNLSRYTVGFSDLAWQSVGLDGKIPLFPSAAEVGQYLEKYRERFIPDEKILFRHKVISTELKEDGRRWAVTTETRSGRKDTSVFDYLINSAGFFNIRRSPGLPFTTAISDSKVKVIHTSECQDLSDLLGPLEGVQAGKIVIFGGGNSSAETAASIASQLSSAAWSTPTKYAAELKRLKIHHVTPRPLYDIPPFIPSGTSSCLFTPLDLRLYDLKARPSGPIRSGAGALPREVAEARYAAIQSMVGDQRDLGAEALVTSEQTTPYVGLSESYSEFVRSGAIIPMAGRVHTLESQTADTVTALVSDNASTSAIRDVVAVVYATGYSPSPAATFLPDDVLLKLRHDPTSARLPLLLQQYQTLHPEIPNLAFIGFYEGPYWGMMEMQARLITRRWSEGLVVPDIAAESIEKLAELREAMKRRDGDIPQYWFSDYAGYLEEMSEALGLERLDAPFEGPRDGPVSPARYLAAGDNRAEAVLTMTDMKHAMDACAAGRYRARAVFRALQGEWRLERRIESTRKEMPSGVFSGSCSFHPRQPATSAADFEYLYVETGSFVTDAGMTMTASRRYVYRYREANDSLSVWFVDTEDGLSTDYLFHAVEFAAPRPGSKCSAHAEHLCDADMYVTDYEFEFRAVTLQAFGVQHAVKGPSKDYVACARYSRPPLSI